MLDALHPSSLLSRHSTDLLLDPSRSNVATPTSSQSSQSSLADYSLLLNGNGNGSAAASTAASRRGTVSKGYKGRGRAWGEGQGEEDDDLEVAGSMDRLRVDKEMDLNGGGEEGGWASSRRSESMLSDGGDGFGGERLRILIERP